MRRRRKKNEKGGGIVGCVIAQITTERKCVLVDTKWLPVEAVETVGDMIFLLVAKLAVT